MTHANEGRARFNLVIGDGFWTKLVKPFWLIAFGAIVQTVVIVYLAFYQPLPKIDEKLLTVHNALLDMEARMLAVEQEHLLLFKLLREDGEQHGVLPEQPNEPDAVPLPPQPGRIIGDTATEP